MDFCINNSAIIKKRMHICHFGVGFFMQKINKL